MASLIATVNGAPIDQKALDAAIQSLAQEQFHVPFAEVPAEQHEELRSLALERLIARELIFQAALAEGVVADDAAVAAESARILRLMGQPKDFWQRLAARGLDEAAFLRMVRKDVTVDMMSARLLESVAEPEDAEIRQFFADHHEQLRGQERVRVSHILLPVDRDDPEPARIRARDLRQQAETNDFAELAKRHSVCVSAPGGGDLGMIRRADVDPAFAEAAFSQAVGTVGPPVRTPHGYHLIKVQAREIPPPPTLEDARNRIIGFLKKARGAEHLAAWVADLRSRANIVIT
ncbi:MAG: peptidylprolyl isomerase [Desulfuromonadales bacterium]